MNEAAMILKVSGVPSPMALPLDLRCCLQVHRSCLDQGLLHGGPLGSPGFRCQSMHRLVGFARQARKDVGEVRKGDPAP